MTHLAVAVLAAGAATGVTLGLDRPAPPASATAAAPLPGSSAVPTPAVSPAVSPAAGGGTGSRVQQVVNKVEPGLVVINTTMQYSSEAGAGTGMVINRDGLVLTNNHVIEGSTKITATVVATGKTYPATVVGYDKTGDIALIRLQGAAGLHTVPVGNSAAVKDRGPGRSAGQRRGAGHHHPGRRAGHRAWTRPSPPPTRAARPATETLHGMIQTSANIVPGDSGGPLSTASGQVIGMDTAGNSVSLGQQPPRPTGFAIPIDTALSVARQIAAGHASSAVTIGYPPFIGIFTSRGSQSNPQAQAERRSRTGSGTGSAVRRVRLRQRPAHPSCYTSNANLQSRRRSPRSARGALVDGTICGSPAATAGITGGSVITAVNGSRSRSPDQLTSILARYRPGKTSRSPGSARRAGRPPAACT